MPRSSINDIATVQTKRDLTRQRQKLLIGELTNKSCGRRPMPQRRTQFCGLILESAPGRQASPRGSQRVLRGGGRAIAVDKLRLQFRLLAEEGDDFDDVVRGLPLGLSV